MATNSNGRESLANKFACATYNVCFGMTDRQGSPHPQERMKAVVQELRRASAQEAPLLFVGFQEIVPELTVVLQPALENAGYVWFQQPNTQTTNLYGCAVAVHRESVQVVETGWWGFESTSTMQRGFLYVQAALTAFASPGEQPPQVLFTTTHLESPLEYEGTLNHSAQVRQLHVIETFCNDQLQLHKAHLHLAIMSGDFNWDEQVPGSCDFMQTLQTPGWKDVWIETTKHLHSESAAGFTYDCIQNPWRQGERQGQLDRILMKRQEANEEIRDVSLSHAWTPCQAELIGQNGIPNVTIDQEVWESSASGLSTPVKKIRKVLLPPSDHYGLVVTLCISKKK